jgi:hypothetical protein
VTQNKCVPVSMTISTHSEIQFSPSYHNPDLTVKLMAKLQNHYTRDAGSVVMGL